MPSTWIPAYAGMTEQVFVGGNLNFAKVTGVGNGRVVYTTG